MARTSDISVYAGADTAVEIAVVDEAGAPVNMGAWALTFIMRDRARGGTGTTRVTKSTPSGITLSNSSGTNDLATVAIADTDTLSLTEGRRYEATLWRTDAGTDVPLWYGQVTLTAVAQQP